MSQEPMATFSKDPPKPRSFEEAQQFHAGFQAGATAYAAMLGHSCLRSDNQELRAVLDCQGWETLNNYERTPPIPEQLEKPINEWLAANQKKPEDVRWGSFPLGMVQGWIERAVRSERDGVSL